MDVGKNQNNKYMILVIDSNFGSATSEEMEKIDAFNEKLNVQDQLIMAKGFAPRSKSMVLDHRLDEAKVEEKEIPQGLETYSGFWLIAAEHYESAKQISFEASKACNRKVELRALI